MIQNQKRLAAPCDPNERSRDTRRRPNVPQEQVDVVVISDTFELGAGAEWSTLSGRVSRGEPIRGVCM